jgi:hypothetical protein
MPATDYILSQLYPVHIFTHNYLKNKGKGVPVFNQHEKCSNLLYAGFMLGSLFEPEDGGDTFPQNDG